MVVDIRRITKRLQQKYETTDPFEIAHFMGIIVQIGKLDFDGCYMFIKNHRCIFLNEDLSEHDLRLVMAHELGHSILHRKLNCYYIRNKTLFLNSRVEIDANKFAVELLIPDDFLFECRDFTIGQISKILGYHERLLELRLK